jgi:hypothetical protein
MQTLRRQSAPKVTQQRVTTNQILTQWANLRTTTTLRQAFQFFGMSHFKFRISYNGDGLPFWQAVCFYYSAFCQANF